MSPTKLVSIVVVSVSVGFAAIAKADEHGPQIMGVTVTANPDPMNPAGYGIPSHLVDNSGMDGDVQERGAPAVDEDAFRFHAWLQTPAVLTFDLGSVQAVGQMGLWNYLEFDNASGTSQDLKNFTLMYSSDDVTYTSLGLKQATRLNGEAPTPGGALSDHDNFTIGASARYIQIDIPYGAQGTAYNNYGSDFVGLGEVRFYAPPAGGLPGDYNTDGKVNAADYVIWRKNPAAFNGDPAGYNIWRANFGAGSGTGVGGSAAVPEPSTLMLAAMGLLAAKSSFRCKRKFRKQANLL